MCRLLPVASQSHPVSSSPNQLGRVCSLSAVHFCSTLEVQKWSSRQHSRSWTRPGTGEVGYPERMRWMAQCWKLLIWHTFQLHFALIELINTGDFGCCLLFSTFFAVITSGCCYCPLWGRWGFWRAFRTFLTFPCRLRAMMGERAAAALPTVVTVFQYILPLSCKLFILSSSEPGNVTFPVSRVMSWDRLVGSDGALAAGHAGLRFLTSWGAWRRSDMLSFFVYHGCQRAISKGCWSSFHWSDLMLCLRSSVKRELSGLLLNFRLWARTWPHLLHKMVSSGYTVSQSKRKPRLHN